MRKVSVSGIRLLSECERKAFYKYILGRDVIKPDPDAPKKVPFDFGNVFHEAMEDNFKGKDITLEYIEDKAKEYIHSSLDKTTGITTYQRVLSPEKEVLDLYAMAKVAIEDTKRLLNNYGLVEVDYEIGFENKKTRGFIDRVLKDKSGHWYICDWKTRREVPKVASAIKDPQAAHYMSFYTEIAKMLRLDTMKFKGIIFHNVTKPSCKRSKLPKQDVKEEVQENPNTIWIKDVPEGYKESREDYIKKLLEGTKQDKTPNIQVVHHFVPFSQDMIVTHWKNFKGAHAKYATLDKAFKATGEAVGTCNYDQCIDSYGAHCDYWSQCHDGKTFTEDMKIIDLDFNKLLERK